MVGGVRALGDALNAGPETKPGSAGQLAVLEELVAEGAAVVALTIDEEGQARTAETKVAIAERLIDVLAQKLNIDKAEIRLRNFVRKEQFPYPSPLRFVYDSGDYHTTLNKALETIGYEDYVTFGGENGARDAGRMRLEGKSYVVADGDVMHFRFAT